MVRPLLVVAPAVRDNLKMNTILASSAVDDSLKSLDHVVAKSPDEPSASNVTVSLAGLRHIVLSGLVIKRPCERGPDREDGLCWDGEREGHV